jgi:hypothetical protein
MKKTSLKENYEKACNAYLRAFCKKHGFGYEPDAWVAGKSGGVASIGDCYYLDMETIITDMETGAPEEAFKKWHGYCLRAGSLGCETPSFKSWLAGFPVMPEAELEELEAMHRKIEKLKEELENRIKRETEDEDS